MTHGGTVSDSVLIGAFLFLENVLYIVKIFKKILSVDKSPRLILLISCKRKLGDNQISLIAQR